MVYFNPLTAAGVLASTWATDAAYVFFNTAVIGSPALGSGELERNLVPAFGICGDQLHT